MKALLRSAVFALVCACLAAPSFGKLPSYSVGVASVDVTPDYPVRLAGYAVRTNESQGVGQRIWAKALAFGSNRERIAILITVDNCGVPINVRNEVVTRLKQLKGIDPDRVTICSTHTHSAPLLHGYLTNLFLGPLPPDQDQRVARYTSELTQHLVNVACSALDDRKPATISFEKGAADFAANRRVKGGPVDHDVPVLFVRSPEGEVRAIFASYACHCTTLTGQFNEISGDWAGCAQEQIEKEHPGAVCLIALGCAGDANPNPRPGIEYARQHGAQIAKVASQLLANDQKPVTGKLVIRTREIKLPYDKLPTREEWEAKLKSGGYIEQHARINLARLDRGEKLPTSLPYKVQTWAFGDSLLMVFLPGEVTSEYGLRLKKEFDSERIWVNAYANDVPCYVPSEEVLKRGGYEAGDSMVYYDRPTRFAPGVEDLILKTVRRISPERFRVPGYK